MQAKAVFTHNNGYDSVVLENGTALQVTPEIFADFVNSQEIDLSNWNGNESWDDEYDDIYAAAAAYGQVIAAYDEDNQLIITDNERWVERNSFYSGN